MRHAGRLFHVQTEDSGLSRLYVTTHLFIDGTILSTTRSQYAADDPDEVVQKKMQTQHKTMLKRLRDGDFDQVQDLGGRPPPRGEPAPELGIPREVGTDAASSTLRMALPDTRPDFSRGAATASGELQIPASAAATSASSPTPGEVVRPPLGPILAPVAPPPILPRQTPPSGSLAERLRRNTGGGSSSVAPPSIPPVPPPSPPPISRPTGPQAVLEFEADLPGDEDDLEPAVTIEVAEPGASEGEATLMSYGVPPAVPPGPPTVQIPVPPGPPTVQILVPPGPPTVQIPVPPAAITDPITAPIPPTAAAGPTAPPRAGFASPGAVAPPIASPVTGLPPLPTRPIPATGLRSRPTAEGVVLQRTLVPTPLVRPGLDSVRTTSPRARPTAPAPLAVAQPIHPLDDERSLDPVVLAYLAREPRPRNG